MALSDKTFLLLTDDPEVRGVVEAALRPVVKSVVSVSSSAEAARKTLEVFDGFILRTRAPTLTDPKGLFMAIQANKQLKAAPWVVLGRDIESEQVLIAHSRVKFVDNPVDGAQLLQILEGLFFEPARAPAEKLDVSFVNPLMGAVVSVLKSMGGVDLERGKPFLRGQEGQPAVKGDISGIIAMNSDRFVGSLAISFDKALILEIYKNMLGTPVETIDDDVADAVSELTNVIFGNAKRDLNALGHTIAPALPSVVRGPGHEVRHNVAGYGLCLPFKASVGTLLVECVIKIKT